ncbi:hypothetical protein ACFX10_019547 [Malus domestica]
MAPRLITSNRQSASSSTQSELSAPSATVGASGIRAMTAESATGMSPTTSLPPAPQFARRLSSTHHYQWPSPPPQSHHSRLATSRSNQPSWSEGRQKDTSLSSRGIKRPRAFFGA